ncbi:DegT/DnrJ/EryC1/StrS family aminotransferase [Streptomyces sp. NPDC017936]|uniref:DegT/DnrJ/EryC1/StrS family aminotransferase n=1 Tax=Streptomyces sp. NPDC017936 TaxID=3365016 RepID=UPI00379D0703
MGWDYRIDVLAAAFARSQLEQLPDFTAARQADGAALTEALTGLFGIRTPHVPDDRAHVSFFSSLLVAPEDYGLEGMP